MARRASKIAVAAAVLGAGLGAASLFRQPAPPAVDQASPERALVHPEVSPRLAPSVAFTAPMISDPILAAKTEAALIPPPIAAPEPADAPALKEIAPADLDGGMPADPAPPPLSESFSAAPPSEFVEPSQTAAQLHKVADGDTLTQLAERYLGSAERYLEIFNANRDLLETPDLLPIGKELRIPPRQPAMVPIKPADEDDAPLVPVVRSPQAPQAKSGRSYQLKQGESLVDVARKIYGDGRQHDRIFAANRHQMRHPGDLRPGLVLVVP